MTATPSRMRPISTSTAPILGTGSRVGLWDGRDGDSQGQTAGWLCARKRTLPSRLLRQSAGFEGLGSVAIDLEPNQHAVADRELVSVSKLDRYATPLPLGVDPDQDEYALIIDVDKARLAQYI